MDFLRLGFNRDALSNYIGKTEVPFVKTWSSEAYIERFVAKVESNSVSKLSYAFYCLDKRFCGQVLPI